MELDSSLIDYMKKRAEYAKLFYTALALQCFALAVFFCAFGLYENVYRFDEYDMQARIVIISASSAISILLLVINRFVCIKYKKLINDLPDDTALRQSEDVVREAYKIARPVLIHKITIAVFIPLLAFLAGLILFVFLEQAFMAGLYTRILVCLALGFTFIYGFTAADRIDAYRCALNETHGLYANKKGSAIVLDIIMTALPLVIQVWYCLRYYSDRKDIAFVSVPITVLFASAIAFLINWASLMAERREAAD